jgi:hypothetical protein
MSRIINAELDCASVAPWLCVRNDLTRSHGEHGEDREPDVAWLHEDRWMPRVRGWGFGVQAGTWFPDKATTGNHGIHGMTRKKIFGRKRHTTHKKTFGRKSGVVGKPRHKWVGRKDLNQRSEMPGRL